MLRKTEELVTSVMEGGEQRDRQIYELRGRASGLAVQLSGEKMSKTQNEKKKRENPR